MAVQHSCTLDGDAFDAQHGESVFQACMRAGLLIDNACSGAGTCFRCRIVVDKPPSMLNPPSDAEQKGLGSLHLAYRTRLACQVRVECPLTLRRKTRIKGLSK